MTIAQQFLGKKIQKSQQEPLVPAESSGSYRDAEEGKPVVVTMHAHVRRVSSMTTLCVFLTALIVCGTGIIGGVYLYRQLSHYKLRRFHGWCSIPYNGEKQAMPIALSVKDVNQATESWESANMVKNNYFEEEFDIDIKFEKFERIDVPSFAHGRKAHFIHDFVENKTAIADYENSRCFVMTLNRQFVYPPRRLYNLVSKMRAGYYDADTQIVRQTLRVVTPRLFDMKYVGLIIARDCSSSPIYLLEHVSTPVYKRSLEEESKELFVEFAGNKITEYKITNLKDAVPGK